MVSEELVSCDTFVVMGNSTLSGETIFGKNSDRSGKYDFFSKSWTMSPGIPKIFTKTKIPAIFFTLFRPKGEIQEVVFIPSQKHETKVLKCTYIEVEQKQETNAGAYLLHCFCLFCLNLKPILNFFSISEQAGVDVGS